ncbi:cytochrome C [Trinickia sp. EG282A]|uniref:cytochrome C n=1 Tax=Trinickia sp. EG282A TaxID=3237013 RepID=UPI0034D23C69
MADKAGAFSIMRPRPIEDPGQAIFREGRLPSGAPLEAVREGGMHVEGAAAACMNCHRRSGFGSKSGLTSIPPITGRYLLHPRAQTVQDLDIPFVETMRFDRDPYTDATIARAVRDGIDSQGHALSYLMPRFELNDADMASLIGYLKRLDHHRVPGVEDTVLHFATVVTPDADPVKRDGMLDVMKHYFEDKNAFPLGATPPLRTSRKMMFMVNRRWALHVWTLTGPASTWKAQLEQHMAAEPVFAIVSGIGGKNWAPVQAFCEEAEVPCLFPNVEVPGDSGANFYPVFFSRGVRLEADLMAKRIAGAQGGHRFERVVQLYRAGDNGEAGAQALATALRREGIDVTSHALGPAESVAAALRATTSDDALVLWLRPADIARLGDRPRARTVFISGLMAGLENAPLPAGWRSVTEMAYPFDLPEKRRWRLDFALGWFSIRHIPVVDLQVQADTYLACGILAETLSHMTDAFVRDYLVERIEDMLEHRLVTGYYPRLTLAPGQRFASKGGYFVRFADPRGTRIVADGNWLVP